MKKPCKILCLHDYNAHTGFATVTKNVKRELKNHFKGDIQLDICAINYFGEPYHEEDGTYVISAVKSAPKKDDFGRYGFLKILKDSNEYDGIFIIQDLGVIVPIIEILRHIKREKAQNNLKQFKSIFYFPVDFKLMDILVKDLEFFDCLIAYTEYGRKCVLDLRPELKSKLKVIPHGNNPKDFYPLPQNEINEFREQYFGKENCKKFIVTNVNRNQPRKDIPNTIFAFLEAKRQWKQEGLTNEPFLYLHMNTKDPMGWDVRAILKQTELVENKDFKLLDTQYNTKDGMPVDMLNKVYNASDLYLTTTLGEGWGLTLTEAMSTKTPIICPLSTSFIEMTDNGNRAYTIDSLIPTCSYFDNVIRHQCDIYETADMIIHVAKGLEGQLEVIGFMDNYNNRIENAYKWVNSLDWKQVCKSWIECFKETY